MLKAAFKLKRKNTHIFLTSESCSPSSHVHMTDGWSCLNIALLWIVPCFWILWRYQYFNFVFLDYNSHLTAEEAKVQNEIDLESLFFEVEAEVEKGITRRTICLDGEGEQQYLQDISEVLLYLLLPAEDFQNKTVRFFLREIIATSVLLPTVNMICDPDYVNQTISWLVR